MSQHTVPDPLPPMNGTLKKLYDIASLSPMELKKLVVIGAAIKDIALVNVYMYTEIMAMKKDLSEILTMIKAMRNRPMNERHGDEKQIKEKDSFSEFTKWFVDHVLPTLVIAIIYVLTQMTVAYLKGK